jgi:hypothetical protein
VGIWPRHQLVDGSDDAAGFSFWFKDVGFGVENYGTDPPSKSTTPQDTRGSRSATGNGIMTAQELVAKTKPDCRTSDRVEPVRALLLPRRSAAPRRRCPARLVLGVSAMDERRAAVTAVMAVETADRARTVWTDADRAWASARRPKLKVGLPRPPPARRAQLALERIGARASALARRRARNGGVGRDVRHRGGIHRGRAADHIGSAAHQYPGAAGAVPGHLEYRGLCRTVGYVVHYGDAAAPGPLRRAVARLSVAW